jgi:5'-AMP-activated protein kinase catalytic alpha subunit
MSARKNMLGEYKVGKTLGEGAFSKVKLAVHRSTGEKARSSHHSNTIGCHQSRQKRQGKSTRFIFKQRRRI